MKWIDKLFNKIKKKHMKYLLVLMACIIAGTVIYITVREVQKDQNARSAVAVSENLEIVDVYIPLTSSAEIMDENGNIHLYAGEEYAMQMDLASEDEEEKTYWGYTNLGIAQVENHLNVRETPSENGTLVGKMSNNAACEILDIDENGWAHIKSGKIEGYVSSAYLLQGLDAVTKGAEVVTKMATVTCETLKVREQPNTDCPVITLIPMGEEMEVKGIEEGWVQIDLDGEDAYISAEYVTIDEHLYTAISMTEVLYGEGVSDVRVALIAYAKQFIGNPYVWGGTSLTRGADCSGFTMSVYAHYGISLPHSSRAQANCGRTVSLSDVRPGDLIFYTKGGTINHVAIYIGNGQVVHASSPRTGIKVSSMYYRTPYKAVSLLN